MKITIEVDEEKKQVTSVDGCEKLHPHIVAIIMNNIALKALRIIEQNHNTAVEAIKKQKENGKKIIAPNFNEVKKHG